MKREVLSKLAVAVLVVGLNAGPEQKCRDKSDSSAAISYDYCVWQTGSASRRQRTPAQWNDLVREPATSNLAAKAHTLRVR